VLLGVVIDGTKEMIHYSAAKQQIVAQYQATVEEKLARTCTPF
jgi:hypothetical protein